MTSVACSSENSTAIAADLEGLDELESAEDFLDYFAVPYAPAIVAVNRLHILQRFHDYLAQARRGGEPPSYADYHDGLLRAYGDFVVSDALSEKVFRVLKRASGITTIPLTSIGRVRR